MAAYLAKSVTKRRPVGLVRRADLENFQLLRPDSEQKEAGIKKYVSMSSQSIQEIALQALNMSIIDRSHDFDLLYAVTPDKCFKSWSNGHFWRGKPGGADYASHLARKGPDVENMAIEAYFSVFNFHGGKRKRPCIAYLLLPPVPIVKDIRRAAWYFI